MLKIYVVPFSFEKGDIFIVLNEMGDGWLWSKSQRTGEEGQIHEALVDDLVRLQFYEIAALTKVWQNQLKSLSSTKAL